jgi:hypothetical protein
MNTDFRNSYRKQLRKRRFQSTLAPLAEKTLHSPSTKPSISTGRSDLDRGSSRLPEIRISTHKKSGLEGLAEGCSRFRPVKLPSYAPNISGISFLEEEPQFLSVEWAVIHCMKR